MQASERGPSSRNQPVNADLERLIKLQSLDSAAEEARRRIAAEPALSSALDARLESARHAVALAKEHLAENQNARRTIEKDVAVHQGRLSKFREQAMAVKTNQEYHAIQHEIAFAQTGIKELEDKILEHMLEADDLVATTKKAEAVLASEVKAVEAERKALAADIAASTASLERLAAERAALARQIDQKVLAAFELISQKRNGVAVAEARDGHCTLCHVRLRPQAFNTIRRNDDLVQCDSCQRFLYFAQSAAAPQVGEPAQPAQ